MKLQEIKHNGYRWINITEPDQKMVEYLEQNFKFHPLDLEDILSKVTYPKIDVYPSYLFVILQFPIYEDARHMFKRSEVSMFIGSNYLITINDGQLAPLQNFFENVRQNKPSRHKYAKKSIPMLLWEILDDNIDQVFPLINEKNGLIFELEEEIYEKPEVKDMIKEIMTLKRDIINVRRILGPQRQVLADLGAKHPKFIPEETKVYYEDLVDKQDKIINQLDTSHAYVKVLEDANESLITRNTNNIVKTLTIFTVITQLPPIVFDYYGMNIGLPFQNSPHAVSLVNVITLIMVLTTLFFFKARRWF